MLLCVYVLIWRAPCTVRTRAGAARRGAARGCGRCGGSRVHAGSDLTLDSRAHVYAYTTPAAARRHRRLPALNTLNILHAHRLTERRRYPPTALPKNSQSRRVHIRRTWTLSRETLQGRQKEGTLVKRKLADCRVLSVNFLFQLVTLIYQNQIIYKNISCYSFSAVRICLLAKWNGTNADGRRCIETYETVAEFGILRTGLE